MATKLNPGAFDCYENAKDDEPMFVLLGRDADAPMLVKQWAFFRLQQIALGIRPESERSQVSEAVQCATDMEIWGRDYRQRKEHAAMEFNDRGLPLTGPHAQKVRNTTSGATDE